MDVTRRTRSEAFYLASKGLFPIYWILVDAGSRCTVAHTQLELPPPADEVDPTTVPAAHRQLFLTTLETVVHADGKVVPAESESLQLFRDLMSGGE